MCKIHILHNFCKSLHLLSTIHDNMYIFCLNSIGSKTFAVKDVEHRGGIGSKFHMICKCRHKVATTIQ